jgi:hypothetical protein
LVSNLLLALGLLVCNRLALFLIYSVKLALQELALH